MDKHPKTIIDRITTPGWNPLPMDVRKEFAIRNVGDGPPGLYQLLVNQGDPDGYFDRGQQVGIVADEPAVGWVFEQWTGDTGDLDDPSSAETFIIMPDRNVEITAGYVAGVYDLVVNSGTGSGSYTYNQYVLISADPPPSELHEFDQWTGDTAGIVDIFEANTAVNMPPNNAEITATYKLIYYDLVVNQGSGDGNYLKGTLVEIAADPPAFGKKFDTWDGDIGTVLSPHLPMTYIDMQGDYTVTATYVNIEQVDPDAVDGYYDIPNTHSRDTYDNEYLGNTNPDPAINRYFDVPDKNSKVVFTSIAIGTATPGGGAVPNAGLQVSIDTPMPLFQELDNPGDFPGISPGAATAGGGDGNNVALDVLLETDFSASSQFNEDQDIFPGGITYTAYSGYREIIADADALVQSGFQGNNLNLDALRDSNNGSDIYTSGPDPVGAYIGVSFPAARSIGSIWWYSVARNGRIEQFVVERYNSGVWTKVPITAVSSLVSIVNTDEGEASNQNGWMGAYFTAVSDVQFRIRVLSYYNGDANCGLTEMRFYEEF